MTQLTTAQLFQQQQVKEQEIDLLKKRIAYFKAANSKELKRMRAVLRDKRSDLRELVEAANTASKRFYLDNVVEPVSPDNYGWVQNSINEMTEAQPLDE